MAHPDGFPANNSNSKHVPSDGFGPKKRHTPYVKPADREPAAQSKSEAKRQAHAPAPSPVPKPDDFAEKEAATRSAPDIRKL